MSRRIVYLGSLWLFLGAAAMTLAATIMPEWISWDVEPPFGLHIHESYGLHTHCSSLTGRCKPFPSYSECSKDASASARHFCSTWRTAGFFMSLAVVLELTTLVAFGVLILGGKQKRERGWKILVGFLTIDALVKAVALSLMGYTLDNDDRFIPGWKLDKSFWLCLGSAVLQLATATGVTVAKFTMEEEGGYELIPDRGD